MTSPRRGFRPHGLFLAAMLPAVILSLSRIGPAAADEVAYLMYAPGNKGKTEPIRILWDELDQANARITIDVGEQFEPWLKRIGLGRVLKYDAKSNKQQFVVRDPQLTSYVKTVTNAIVQGIVQASVPPGEPAPPAEADVKGATLLISPAPGRAHTLIELIARLHVSYLAPQKSGPPRLADLINSDLTFVGEPEPMAPDDVARAIEKAFGAHIPEFRKASVKPGEQVKQADEATFAAALRRMRLSQAANTQIDTVVDRSRNPPVVYIRPDAPPYTSAHEVTQLYQSDAFRALGRLGRGLTHVFADEAVADRNTGRSRFDFSPSYGRETSAARALLDGYGRDLVLPAYFGREPNAIKALSDAVDRRRGRGTFDRFLDLLGRGEATPSQARLDQAVALIKP
jgi:hypothetical protein